MTSPAFIVAASLILTATGTGAKAAPASDRNQSSATKYCIEYEKMVGSRLSQTDCKTKKDWADVGIDVDELLKKEPTRK